MQKNPERLAAEALCLFAGGALTLFFFKYLLPVLTPFLLAFLFSLLLRPIVPRMSGGKHCGVLAAALTTGFFALLLTAVRLLTRRVAEEAERLPELLRALGETVASADSPFARLEERLAETGTVGESLLGALENLPSVLGEKLTVFLAETGAKMLADAPNLLFATVICLAATYYFTVPKIPIPTQLQRRLPPRIAPAAERLRVHLKALSFRYAKAYLLLLFLTFAELFVGFSILQIDYALLLAVAVSLVDFLPILGVGTVLVPFAAVSFLQKDYRLAVGLLLLYAILTVVRQVIEPKLVGKSLGMHPLLTLFAGFAGLRLFGFAGMLLLPILLTVALQIKRGIPAKKTP